VRSQTNSSVGFRFGFTGRELDSETGNYYYNSRYYDPQVGRFISEDTVGFGGGDTNLYRYVGNSPTNYTDPSGEQVPVAVPLPAPALPLPPLGGLLRRVPGLGILLAPPGGGGLLNPWSAGEDDRLFEERVRRGLIRPQGQTQPTPPLNRPKPRPQSDPAPSTSPASPPLPNPDCKTCADDPELKKYVKCETIFRGTGGEQGILIGFRYNSLEDAANNLQKTRRELANDRQPNRERLWWLQSLLAPVGALPYKADDKLPCPYPKPTQDGGARHYNVEISANDNVRKDQGWSSSSAGSLGRCECCEDTVTGPKKRVKFSILNIKNANSRKIHNSDL
jgi:RHS repeat-associated protein